MRSKPERGSAVRSRSFRWRIGWLLALLFVPAAATSDEREDELERWVPSFALFFDMLGQKAEGSITTGAVQGPPLTTGGCEITNPVTGVVTKNGTLCPSSRSPLTPGSAASDTAVTPLVGASLELMTPRVLDGLLGPRLFLHADAAAAFGFERNLAGERKPDNFAAPELNTNTRIDTPELAVVGQGSRAKVQVKRLIVSAGGGVAFSTVLFERTLRIKPSFEYLTQEVDLLGSVHRAVKLSQPAALNTLEDFRLIDLAASAVERQHGLGGGLEIELDAGRLGPFVLSIFGIGRGYRFLGNLDHTLTAANEFGETASWQIELDPWAWRGGAGVRFRWVPE